MGMPKMSDEDKLWGAINTGALAHSLTEHLKRVNALLTKMNFEDRTYIRAVGTPGNPLLSRLSRAEQILFRCLDKSIQTIGRQLDHCDLVHILIDQNAPTRGNLADRKLAARWRNCLLQYGKRDPDGTRWAYPKMRLVGWRAKVYLGWNDSNFWFLLDAAYVGRRPNTFLDVYELVDCWQGLALPKAVEQALMQFQKKAAELARHGISADQLTDVLRAEVARQHAAAPPKVSVTFAGVGHGSKRLVRS